jgi:hypothetical protein
MILSLQNITSYRRSIPSSALRFFLVAFVGIAAVAVLQRPMILNGFSVLPGDRYDGVISAAILEHWYRVFTRTAQNWADASYFYPYSKTIAQTDAFFINSILYAPFRLVGFDPFQSMYLSGVLLKVVGFYSFYLLCRRFKQISFGWALLASALFTLSNGMTVHSSRIQFATVALAPAQALLIWNTFEALYASNRKNALIWGVSACALFGAWCLSCFYMAWFFAFFFLATLIVMGALAPRKSLGFLSAASRQWPVVVLLVVAGAACMFPFIYVFLPKSVETGVRTYGQIKTIPIYEVMQVGNENLLYGGFYNKALKFFYPTYAPGGEYYNCGFNVVVIALFLAGCFSVVRCATSETSQFVLKSIALSAVITWICTISIGGHSLWFYVFHSVPGAKAFRVVAGYEIFLAMPVFLVVASYLSSIRMPAVIGTIFVGLLLAGELNEQYTNLHVDAENARIANVPIPPEACKAFYVSGWKGQGERGSAVAVHIENLYQHNVTAIMLAQMLSIPTVNGFASFNPPDWDFASPNSPDYEARIAAYARRHQISGLCRLDLNNKSWSQPQS